MNEETKPELSVIEDETKTEETTQNEQERGTETEEETSEKVQEVGSSEETGSAYPGTRTGVLAPESSDEEREEAELTSREEVEASKGRVYSEICAGLKEAQEELSELFGKGYASEGLREAIRLLGDAEKIVRKELHR